VTVATPTQTTQRGDRVAGLAQLPLAVLRKYHKGFLSRLCQADVEDLIQDGRMKLLRMDTKLSADMDEREFRVRAVKSLKLYYRSAYRRLNGVFRGNYATDRIRQAPDVKYYDLALLEKTGQKFWPKVRRTDGEPTPVAAEVEAFLGMLSAGEREVIEARYLRGMSLNEMTTDLGIHRATAIRRLHSAFETFRRNLP
jgi:RNA polymerase sigma factor (sigma-70 family)